MSRDPYPHLRDAESTTYGRLRLGDSIWVPSSWRARWGWVVGLKPTTLSRGRRGYFMSVRTPDGLTTHYVAALDAYVSRRVKCGRRRRE